MICFLPFHIFLMFSPRAERNAGSQSLSGRQLNICAGLFPLLGWRLAMMCTMHDAHQSMRGPRTVPTKRISCKVQAADSDAKCWSLTAWIPTLCALTLVGSGDDKKRGRQKRNKSNREETAAAAATRDNTERARGSRPFGPRMRERYANHPLRHMIPTVQPILLVVYHSSSSG